MMTFTADAALAFDNGGIVKNRSRTKKRSDGATISGLGWEIFVSARIVPLVDEYMVLAARREKARLVDRLTFCLQEVSFKQFELVEGHIDIAK